MSRRGRAASVGRGMVGSPPFSKCSGEAEVLPAADLLAPLVYQYEIGQRSLALAVMLDQDINRQGGVFSRPVIINHGVSDTFPLIVR